MKRFNPNFRALIALTCLFSLPIMTMEKPAPKQAWLQKAKDAQIASPLKIRVVNHTAKTIKSNKGQDEWAPILHNYGLENPSFDMDKPAQYTIRSENNVYVMNVEKSGNTFKALLEKIDVPASELKDLTDSEILNLAAIAHKTPAGQIAQVEPGNVVTVVLDEDSAEITTNEHDQLTLGKMGKGWINVATDPVTGHVSDPVKMRVINHTGAQVRTVQQGRGNLWWAEVDPNYIFEDMYFNLVNLDENPRYEKTLKEEYKKAPQYTISSDKNLYTVNFVKVKNSAYFKAILERIEGLAKDKPLSESTLGDLLNLAKYSAKTPVQDIEPVKQSDIVTVTLDEDHNAQISVNE